MKIIKLVQPLVLILALFAVTATIQHNVLVEADASEEQEAVVDAEEKVEKEEKEEAQSERMPESDQVSESDAAEECTGSISGMLWLDMFEDTENSIYSGNGIYEADEKPLAGYDVSLYISDDMSSAVQETKTDEDGKYYFEDLEPGEYIVCVATEIIDDVEYLLPIVGISGNNKFEIDTENGESAFSEPINIDSGTFEETIDAGMRTPPSVMKANRIKFDISYNGYYIVQDEYGDIMVGAKWKVFKYKKIDDKNFEYYELAATGSTDKNGFTQFNVNYADYAEPNKWVGLYCYFQTAEGVTQWDASGLYYMSYNGPGASYHKFDDVKSSEFNKLDGIGLTHKQDYSFYYRYGNKAKPVTLRMLREVEVTFDAQGGTLNSEKEKLAPQGGTPAPSAWWDYWSYQTFTVSAIEYKKANIIDALPTPKRDGWVFEGWYTAKSGGSAVTNNDMVGKIFPSPTNTGTLYARWSTDITEKYVDTNGNSIADDTSAKIISSDSSYSIIGTMNDITKDNDRYRYVGYLIGKFESGGTIKEGMPTINEVTGPETVYLIYARITDFTFLKVNSAGYNEPLADAKFNLYTCTDTDTHMHTRNNDIESCWELVDTQTSGDDNASTKGLVKFIDLVSGTYLLEEIQAPSGFQLPTGQWCFEINDEGEIIILPSVGENRPPAIQKNDADEIPYLIGNLMQYKLPEMGGSGSGWFTVIGIILMTAGVLSVVICLRRRR